MFQPLTLVDWPYGQYHSGPDYHDFNEKENLMEFLSNCKRDERYTIIGFGHRWDSYIKQKTTTSVEDLLQELERKL